MIKPLFCFLCISCVFACHTPSADKLRDEDFMRIARTLSQSWNEGNARAAADLFAEDAVYEEPPKKQFYKGRKEIFDFFGGEEGFDRAMKMTWHNLAFDEASQVGFGEYTFSLNNQYHGIVVMKFEGGKITKWREYQYRSDADWKNFAGESEFAAAE